MEILITGVAGFIGSNLADHLLEKGFHVTGIDNFDPFYSRSIKENNIRKALENPNFSFFQADITVAGSLDNVPFKGGVVVHLAAKTGVRPSIADPAGYIQTNITGTQHILEWMRKRNLKKMVFASSSSVYGNNQKIPFSESDNVDNPISPYAFTKKACELMNYTYHHLHEFDIINLRFFTVYGERQRPDLAIHKFTRAISQGKEIEMFGQGDTSRDYTYIKDIIAGIDSSINLLEKDEKVYEIINLGNSQPIKLSGLVEIIGHAMGVKPQIRHLPKQPGDVEITYADITKATSLLSYRPATPLNTGIEKFVAWFKAFGN